MTATPPALPGNDGKIISRRRAVLVFLVLVIVAWLVNLFTSPLEKKSAVVVKNNPSSRQINAMALAYAWKPGDELVYHFTSNGTLAMGAADAAAAAAVLQITETGQFKVKVYTALPSGWLVGLAWDQVELSLKNGQDLHDLTPADLAHTEIFAHLDKFGRITQVQVPYSISSDARNNWRDILARWQVILPQGSASKKWTRVEEDATGTFVAQYAWSDAAITKTKSHYLHITAANAVLAVAYKVAGSAQIQFQDFPHSISGNEKVDLGGVKGVPPTHSTGDYAFALVAYTQGGSYPTPSLDKYTTMAWAMEFNAMAAPAEDDGVFADNVASLEGTIQNGAFGGPEEIAVAGKIIAQIKKDPALADRLLDELRNENTSTPLASALLGILGAAGTPAAQGDLLAVAAADDWPMNFRQMALFSFVQVAEPVPEADAVLKSIIGQGGELAGSSLLDLAAIGDKVRSSDPARFQEINDYVAGVLNTPGLSLNDFIVTLDAIGNLGPGQVPDAVAKATTNDNELIRAKAIASLSRIQTDVALALVTNAIVNDPSGEVQAAAVKTFAAMKKEGAVPDLMNIAANGRTVAARKEALTQLSGYSSSNPTIATAIGNAAQSDPSSEVRDYAAKLQGSP